MVFFAYLAIIAVSYFLSTAAMPKPPKQKPAMLADFDVPTAELGREVSVLFGTELIEDPNVIWFGDLSSKAIKSKGGKK